MARDTPCLLCLSPLLLPAPDLSPLLLPAPEPGTHPRAEVQRQHVTRFTSSYARHRGLTVCCRLIEQVHPQVQSDGGAAAGGGGASR